MIAVDTSTLVAYFSGEKGRDTEMVHEAILGDKAAICPIVITEMLSGTTDTRIASLIATMQKLVFNHGFWERAAASRQKLYKKGFKAKLADAIIAQSAIDHATPLLTRDRDFRHYATLCGLKLAEA